MEQFGFQNLNPYRLQCKVGFLNARFSPFILLCKAYIQVDISQLWKKILRQGLLHLVPYYVKPKVVSQIVQMCRSFGVNHILI